MKREQEINDSEHSFRHFFSTVSITLILLLILVFIGSTIYIGYNSFMSAR
jgi:predicted negative regulator of RcsB-dependent stress response